MRQQMEKIRRALLSVSDKSGLVELARMLQNAGVELIASGGTAKALQDAGLSVVSVEKWTGSPELLGGRIKTLHPRIHAGILARREDERDEKDLHALGADFIDLVVVNFYPFRDAVASGKPLPEVIESIDVGGPTMARAAAKNFHHVVVLSDALDYPEFVEAFRKGEGTIPEELRQQFAARTVARLAAYDSAITEHLSAGDYVGVILQRLQECRYGENPHQKGALFVEVGQPPKGLSALKQLQGKALSYNNLQDVHAALMLTREFQNCAAVIIKHATPCGVGLALTPAQAVRRALETDPVSAFGGIVALTKPMDKETAHILAEIFLEVILAPQIGEEALAEFAKKKSLRILTYDIEDLRSFGNGKDMRAVWGGYLRQESDERFPELSDLQVVTKRAPTPSEMEALELAWRVCKHVRSNAIVFADAVHTLGIGAGQMSRVDSVEIAVRKATKAGLSLIGSACASDAFFPFRDGLDAAARAGATAVIEPGGSVRDAEVIEAANEQNVAMVFTGRRHFRH
jgi:phosphoribosylaminoimidazolecarboxamide formyltransferase/IMP cyclohydrolase